MDSPRIQKSKNLETETFSLFQMKRFIHYTLGAVYSQKMFLMKLVVNPDRKELHFSLRNYPINKVLNSTKIWKMREVN